MSDEEISLILDIAEEAMSAALDHLQKELSSVRTGKASTSMLTSLLVSYYGSPTPLAQVSNVATADARTITIQPWEKKMIGPIEKAIFEANLGVTPQNDGELIRISIPPLTEERRRELAKKAKALGEDAKVGIRTARQKAMDGIKKAVKDGYPEDAGKRDEKTVQDMTDSHSKRVEAMVEAKEKDIMTV